MPQEILDARNEKVLEVVLEEQKKDFFKQLLKKIKEKKSNFIKKIVNKLKAKLVKKKKKKKDEDSD